MSIAAHIRFDIPAIIFTAVDTEPKTIKIEIIGLNKSGATPLFTRIKRGIASFWKSGLSVIAISPTTAIKIITIFTKNPITIEVFASSSLSKGLACWTIRPIQPSWNEA